MTGKPIPFDKQSKLLVTRLDTIFKEIKTTRDAARAAEEDASKISVFRGRFRALDGLHQDYGTTFDKLSELYSSEDKEQDFPVDEKRPQAVRSYVYECNSVYEGIMNPIPKPATNLPPCATSTVLESSLTLAQNMSTSSMVRYRLPKINIPVFSGDLTEWTRFRDVFTSIVHDEGSLSSIEKFHHLVGALKGEPLRMVSAFALTAANYELAWKCLTDRYNNKRILASAYLHNIRQFKASGQQSSNPTYLRAFLKIVADSFSALGTLGIENEADYLKLQLALDCLDPDNRRMFEEKQQGTEFPTYKSLIEFVQQRCKILELSESTHYFNKQSATRPKVLSTFTQNKQHETSNSKSSARHVCPNCKKNHLLFRCYGFKDMDLTQRKEIVRANRICQNCLREGHNSIKCPSNFRCYHCKERHHSLLHDSVKRDITLNQSSATKHITQEHPNAHETPNTLMTTHSQPDSIVIGSTTANHSTLLGTALINVLDWKGILQPVRAVLDSGSQFSIITDSCVRRLGLSYTPSRRNMFGVGNTRLPPTKGVVQCTLAPLNDKRDKIETKAIVMTSLTSNLPTVSLNASIKNQFMELHLADEQFWESRPVEFLIGSDLFLRVLTTDPVVKVNESLGTLPTIFGHVVIGAPTQEGEYVDENCLSVTDNQVLDSTLQSFWEVEEIASIKDNIHPDNMKCEEHFLATVNRTSEGRYIIALPFRRPGVTFPNTYHVAARRFRNLELKFDRHPSLRAQYCTFMQEYLDAGHMKLASMPSSYVIPHHAVFKQTIGKESDAQIRVVFDASMATSSGSLNDNLLNGPKLQRDIAVIISNFRRHKVAFCGDIVKMFRQILVCPEHRQFQHILWRFCSEEPLQTYELQTLTYGQSSSPYLALRVLAQLVKDEGCSFPKAVQALDRDIYVDDLITGADSLHEALTLKTELVQLLARGCFPLHKWASNSTAFMKNIPEHSQESEICLPPDDNITKVLGMHWNSKTDCFHFQVKYSCTEVTKRSMLSTIARLFDPLGLLAPTIFLAKHMIQTLWSQKLDWDDALPEHVRENWLEYIQDLPKVSEIQIPRFIRVQEGSRRLFGFCDASEKGYAAVFYVQVTTTDQKVYTSLLMGKTRLAPIKTITIPRLELSAAHLLTKLLRFLEEFRQINEISDILLFTDSTIVLSWLTLLPQQLKTFVSNRVGYILTHTTISQWHHVPSAQNPADVASRGILPGKPAHNELWWKGPTWINKHPLILPASPPAVLDLPDCKTLMSTTSAPEVPDFANSFIRLFSSFSTMTRTLAYVFRFIDNAKATEAGRRNGPLTIKEIEKATLYLIRNTQLAYFQNDYDFQSKASTSARFMKLNVFEDSHQVIRVGGRLSNSSFSYGIKHPILLPRDSHLTTMIINDIHLRFFHLGPKALQAYLLRAYYVFGLKSIVKKCVWNCVRCYKLRAKPTSPFMADLPISRISQGRPFISVGVDFAGPFYMKISTRRNCPTTKAYMCIFVCMAIKAVHIELVSSLSTDAFLAAFDRFVARRGLPTDIHSDCGTNFVGAARQMRELFVWLNTNATQEAIGRHTANSGVQWHFNPPNAPHFGGLWEAAVKSAKNHLVRTLGERPFYYEELETIFCRIEAILNSRPLCPIADNPTDFDCLTPGHFLIGSALIAPPEQDVTDLNVNKLNRWQLLQHSVQIFWKRWTNEYIHTLQPRAKWTKHTTPVKVNDLVLVQDGTTAPTKWRMGRVQHLHPGQDGIIRVAIVKTENGTLKRPVHRLGVIAPLSADI